jgi:5-methyltetrahydrofolate--homocysteine methyltransferase
VYGDVHDIGKNLVKTIFENNGYTVYDLGKQVPLQRFLEEVDRVSPDAIGLSALLVSTSKQMNLFVSHARRNGMALPVLCGGAAINSGFINRIAKEGGVYPGGVFYCNTMFDGLKTMDALVSGQRQQLLDKWRGDLERWQEGPAATPPAQPLPRSSVAPVRPPVPPVTAEPIRLSGDEINMDEVWPLLDKRALFKMSWGLRGKAGAESQEDHEGILEELKGRITRENLFEPQIVYGYFGCHAQDQRLTVDYSGGQVTFDFPRSTRPKHLCITDYFGRDDVVAFQSVTVGEIVSRVAHKWDQEGRYADALYLQGLAVQTAEALAEWTNRRIISELGLKRGGLRYSWGYASCPDVSQHFAVWKLLEPEKSGMVLTSAGQIDPEQSTAAIVLHHPEAEYFVL